MEIREALDKSVRCKVGGQLRGVTLTPLLGRALIGWKRSRPLPVPFQLYSFSRTLPSAKLSTAAVAVGWTLLQILVNKPRSLSHAILPCIRCHIPCYPCLPGTQIHRVRPPYSPIISDLICPPLGHCINWPGLPWIRL